MEPTPAIGRGPKVAEGRWWAVGPGRPRPPGSNLPDAQGTRTGDTSTGDEPTTTSVASVRVGAPSNHTGASPEAAGGTMRIA